MADLLAHVPHRRDGALPGPLHARAQETKACVVLDGEHRLPGHLGCRAWAPEALIGMPVFSHAQPFLHITSRLACASATSHPAHSHIPRCPTPAVPRPLPNPRHGSAPLLLRHRGAGHHHVRLPLPRRNRHHGATLVSAGIDSIDAVQPSWWALLTLCSVSVTVQAHSICLRSSSCTASSWARGCWSRAMEDTPQEICWQPKLCRRTCSEKGVG